jgi:DNA-binding beta-propeller fold protein YncE
VALTDSHAIHEFRVADGSRLRVIGDKGRGPLQFDGPRQVWIASDDFVFVADNGNKRVQVLTPRLDFHGFIGVGTLSPPASVCANDDVVVVAEQLRECISVFSRRSGSLLRRFGSVNGDVDTNTPLGLCFMPGDRHIALTDHFNKRVWVLGIDGASVRHVGVGVLKFPVGVACSAFGELVVADFDNQHVALFSVDGKLLKTMGGGQFVGVAMHGGTVFAQDYKKRCAVVFE